MQKKTSRNVDKVGGRHLKRSNWFETEYNVFALYEMFVFFK